MKQSMSAAHNAACLHLPLVGAVLATAALLAGCGSHEAPPKPAATDLASGPASTTAPAVTDTPPAPRQDASIDVPPWQAALRIMDGDGDGRVSVAEHAATAARMFAKMDSDGDGEVTVDEMTAIRNTLPDARGDTERALRRVDTNENGSLDQHEHAAATHIEFNNIDTNHDGDLDAAELQAADAPSSSP